MAPNSSSIDLIRRLALAAEFKDDGTGSHMERTAALSALLATKMGFDPTYVRIIHLAASIHDVGKIGIPDSILLKPGPLSDCEYEIMKTHTTIGARILQGSDDEMFQVAHEIALYHHERWDGSGYPFGLSGESIPLDGRLVGLVDVFDAMCSPRPYRRAFSVSQACAFIKERRGLHFDPDIVDVFLSNISLVVEIRERMASRDAKWKENGPFMGRVGYCEGGGPDKVA